MNHTQPSRWERSKFLELNQVFDEMTVGGEVVGCGSYREGVVGLTTLQGMLLSAHSSSPFNLILIYIMRYDSYKKR